MDSQTYSLNRLENTHQLASEIRIVPLERMELDAIRAVVSVLFAFMKKLRTG